ncbi:hypothetical protein AN958_01438 [Leucoagaricus sp. SymC.cos]|nr:hypothetical protein AN958_01438 [Leucoagaricus sp. SymC.cos]
MLWDLGSITTGITPSFAHIVGVKVYNLMDPHMLQLEIVGSYLTINFRANIEIKMKDISIKTYVDVVNFNHYNMIIGMLFGRSTSSARNSGGLVENTSVPNLVTGRRLEGISISRPIANDSARVRAQHMRSKMHRRSIGLPEKLPLFHEVNHEIKLIDRNKRYKYYPPHCSQSLRDEFHNKLTRYVKAEWWEPCSMDQAMPLLCVLKKDGQLRTILDVRFHNDNTIKNVTPLLDQEII